MTVTPRTGSLAERFRSRRVVALVTVAMVVLVGIWGYREYRWKQFAEVVPGAVYRSGLLKERQLASAIESLRLRTVVCLVGEYADRERPICAEHGVRFVSIPMHSSGEGDPEDFARVVHLMSDPAAQPILVHCQAGVARTGAAVALFRMSQQGWSFDRAIEELRSFERKGRCEPALQALIRSVYTEKLAPSVADRSRLQSK